MNLSPRETEKLQIYVVADLARRRRDRGVLLNYVEAVALVSETILEGARDGKDVPEVTELSKQVVKPEEVMEGVAEMVDVVQTEATFTDGTKLVTVHGPIGGVEGQVALKSSH
jgi:urease subunit gamma